MTIAKSHAIIGIISNTNFLRRSIIRNITTLIMSIQNDVKIGYSSSASLIRQPFKTKVENVVIPNCIRYIKHTIGMAWSIKHAKNGSPNKYSTQAMHTLEITSKERISGIMCLSFTKMSLRLIVFGFFIVGAINWHIRGESLKLFHCHQGFRCQDTKL